jgi:hypothetical protein
VIDAAFVDLAALTSTKQACGEAGGSLTRETPVRVGSSPDDDGTRRNYRTAWVRQAKREGGREEPAV